jgi:serine phosphatase RsbU (regulator of sigma subunit)
MNSSGDDFGMDRLVESIHEFRELPLDQSLPAIMNRVQDWAGESGIHDDATILGIEYLES